MYQNIKYYAYLQSSISFMKKIFGLLSINLCSFRWNLRKKQLCTSVKKRKDICRNTYDCLVTTTQHVGVLCN